VDTGNDPGTVDIAVASAGTDFNNPALPVGDNGATTVMVQDVAGLYIESTVPVGTFNHATAERDTVNTGFAYQIHVTVQNSGGEDVDSVRVNLTRDGTSVIGGSQIRQSIAAGANRTFSLRSQLVAHRTTSKRCSGIAPGVKSHNSARPWSAAPVDAGGVVIRPAPARREPLRRVAAGVGGWCGGRNS
jgi:hypothetical protein